MSVETAQMNKIMKADGTMKRMIKTMRFNKDVRTAHEDWVASEVPLTLMLNGQELATLLCSPKDMKYLALSRRRKRLRR
jgi:formate dehydrogenase assembly factor FdhD